MFPENEGQCESKTETEQRYIGWMPNVRNTTRQCPTRSSQFGPGRSYRGEDSRKDIGKQSQTCRRQRCANPIYFSLEPSELRALEHLIWR